jgi:hypothetical protein
MSRGSPADITPFLRFLEWRQRRIEQAASTAPPTLIATGGDMDREEPARAVGAASPSQIPAPIERATDVGTGVL